MNQSHLEILSSSVQEWNKWRADNWNIKPDLSGGDLREVNMFKANLDDVNLASADLRGAVMINCTARHADFEHANMDGVQLQGANLTSANLTRAALRDANLTGTVFRNACLMEVDMTGSNCTATHFENANLLNATFYDTQVKGANFEGSNIHEANLYSDQFKEANIPLESLGAVERKAKTGTQYALAFIAVALAIIIGFAIYIGIFRAEEPGAINTKIRAALYLRFGGMFDSLGNQDLALKYLKLSRKYNPENPEVYYMIGSIYRRKKNVRKAVINFRKFVKMAPSAREAGNIKAYLYQFGGKVPKDAKE